MDLLCKIIITLVFSYIVVGVPGTIKPSIKKPQGKVVTGNEVPVPMTFKINKPNGEKITGNGTQLLELYHIKFGEISKKPQYKNEANKTIEEWILTNEGLKKAHAHYEQALFEFTNKYWEWIEKQFAMIKWNVTTFNREAIHDDYYHKTNKTKSKIIKRGREVITGNLSQLLQLYDENYENISLKPQFGILENKTAINWLHAEDELLKKNATIDEVMETLMNKYWDWVEKQFVLVNMKLITFNREIIDESYN